MALYQTKDCEKLCFTLCYSESPSSSLLRQQLTKDSRTFFCMLMILWVIIWSSGFWSMLFLVKLQCLRYLITKRYNVFSPTNWACVRIDHRHTLSDAYSVFESIENYGCQTCVVLYLFFKRLQIIFIWIYFVFANANINKKELHVIQVHLAILN